MEHAAAAQGGLTGLWIKRFELYQQVDVDAVSISGLGPLSVLSPIRARPCRTSALFLVRDGAPPSPPSASSSSCLFRLFLILSSLSCLSRSPRFHLFVPTDTSCALVASQKWMGPPGPVLRITAPKACELITVHDLLITGGNIVVCRGKRSPQATQSSNSPASSC